MPVEAPDLLRVPGALAAEDVRRRRAALGGDLVQRNLGGVVLGGPGAERADFGVGPAELDDLM